MQRKINQVIRHIGTLSSVSLISYSERQQSFAIHKLQQQLAFEFFSLKSLQEVFIRSTHSNQVLSAIIHIFDDVFIGEQGSTCHLVAVADMASRGCWPLFWQMASLDL